MKRDRADTLLASVEDYVERRKKHVSEETEVTLRRAERTFTQVVASLQATEPERIPRRVPDSKRAPSIIRAGPNCEIAPAFVLRVVRLIKAHFISFIKRGIAAVSIM
jgi:hypothetical protein